MCGIAAMFCRESVPEISIFHELLKGIEERGTDGLGIVFILRNNKEDNDNRTKIISFKSLNSYSNLTPSEIKTLQLTYNMMSVGDLIIMNSRAQPETEPDSTLEDIEQTVQPIINVDESIVLVHNGGIANRCVEQANTWSKRYSKIDSEAIIQYYLRYNKDMKRAMEVITGGIAAILYDAIKDGFYMIQSHNPLAHCYIRGYGYFISSMNHTLENVVELIKTKYKTETINLWEDYYCHQIDEPYRIRYVDCDSGMQTLQKFEPNYIHPIWRKDNTLEKIKNPKVINLVIASGGIDSFTTAKLLKLSGQNVICIHYKYNHRGEKSEEWAIKKLCENNDIPLKIFDLKSVYSEIDNFSMLTNDNIKITTGTNDLKTTNAWTCGRNMVFSSLTAAFAESLILSNKYDMIYMASGFASLSEEAAYNDNSYNFIRSLEKMFKLGTLCGNRISFRYVCGNILKSEQWMLAKHLNFLDQYAYTISCDRPYYDEDKKRAYNCDGQCGSTNLSIWSSKISGCEDPREFHHYDDSEYIAFEPKGLKVRNYNNQTIYSIIDRLNIDADGKKKLKSIVKKNKMNKGE